MGVATCLLGHAIRLKDCVVEQRSFGEFAPPRSNQMPQISVPSVARPTPPGGMGQTALPPLAPAFTNTLAELTGWPLRKLPFEMP